MSIVSLDKRLRALEQTRDAEDVCVRPFMGGINLLMLLTAVHLGGFDGREAVATAYARALGYESTRDFRFALTAGEGSDAFADFNERRTEATVRLLALKGAPVIDGPKVHAALRSLWTEMPEHARSHRFAQDIEAQLDTAMEWLCL